MRERRGGGRGGRPTVRELAQQARLKEDEAKRFLDRFRIDPEAVTWGPVDDSQEGEIVISREAPIAKGRILTVKPRSLDELRTWIGVPVAARPEAAPEVMLDRREWRLAHEIDETVDLRAVAGGPQADAINQAAERLLYQTVDAKLAATPLYKAALKYALSFELPIFLATIVNVYPGQTLVVEGSVAAIGALTIRLWRGGTIRVVGPTAIRCQRFEGRVTA